MGAKGWLFICYWSGKTASFAGFVGCEDLEIDPWKEQILLPLAFANLSIYADLSLG
jgi:hypothetical protein